MAESESCRSGDKSAVENAESATKDAEKMLWKKLKKISIRHLTDWRCWCKIFIVVTEK